MIYATRATAHLVSKIFIVFNFNTKLKKLKNFPINFSQIFFTFFKFKISNSINKKYFVIFLLWNLKSTQKKLSRPHVWRCTIELRGCPAQSHFSSPSCAFFSSFFCDCCCVGDAEKIKFPYSSYFWLLFCLLCCVQQQELWKEKKDKEYNTTTTTIKKWEEEKHFFVTFFILRWIFGIKFSTRVYCVLLFYCFVVLFSFFWCYLCLLIHVAVLLVCYVACEVVWLGCSCFSLELNFFCFGKRLNLK